MTKANFLRELKEEGLLKVVWISTHENSSDMFTKNLQGPVFHKHSKVYVSETVSTNSQEEGVGSPNNVSPESLTIESHRGPESVMRQKGRENVESSESTVK